MKLQLTTGILLLVVVMGGFAMAVQSDETATVSKSDDIQKLMELMDAKAMGLQVMQTMMDSFNAVGSPVADDFLKDFMSEVNFGELVELTIPIYEKHFTHDDIKQMIAFYQSPIGKKLLKKQPAILKESMAVGIAWSQKITAKLIEKMRDEEY
jgi:hypothetical protein